MKEVKILCWNVNGIRSVMRKGLLEWLEKESPDVLCLQETKVHPDQLDEALKAPKGYVTCWNQPERKGYVTCWNQPERKGYGGVATFSKEKPRGVRYDLGRPSLTLKAGLLLSNSPASPCSTYISLTASRARSD